MALPAIGDGEQVGDGNTNETLLVGRSGQPLKVQPSSTGTLSFFGQTVTTRPATISTVTTTAATSTTNAYGYSTAAQADAIVTAVNAAVNALIALGLVASS